MPLYSKVVHDMEILVKFFKDKDIIYFDEDIVVIDVFIVVTSKSQIYKLIKYKNYINLENTCIKGSSKRQVHR